MPMGARIEASAARINLRDRRGVSGIAFSHVCRRLNRTPAVDYKMFSTVQQTVRRDFLGVGGSLYGLSWRNATKRRWPCAMTPAGVDAWRPPWAAPSSK